MDSEPTKDGWPTLTIQVFTETLSYSTNELLIQVR
jgi:hypothetical protein